MHFNHFVTGQLNNRNKINIDQRHEWLQKGTRLEEFQSFWDVHGSTMCLKTSR
jgi:hypothetical protein